MNRLPHLALSFLAAALLVGGALAQQATGQRPSRVPPPDAEVLKRADDAFHAAKVACQQEGVPVRQVCIERAREAHAATLGEAGMMSLPALQTQSAAVSATGVAPRLRVGERVHESRAAQAPGPGTRRHSLLGRTEP